VGSLTCFRKLMIDAEYLCVRGFDAVLTADPASTFRNPAIKVELTMKRNKARKEITLKEPFGSSSFPRLSLIIELANGRLTLPKTQEWWGFRNDGDVVWNKKPTEHVDRLSGSSRSLVLMRTLIDKLR
jgi:hypothetical protein